MVLAHLILFPGLVFSHSLKAAVLALRRRMDGFVVKKNHLGDQSRKVSLDVGQAVPSLTVSPVPRTAMPVL